MTVKTTGAEFRRFYDDAAFWPEGAWHEDEEIEVDGAPISDDLAIEDIPESAVLKLKGGVVLGLPDDDGDGVSLESHFKKWRKAQNTVSFVVECDKKDADVLKTTIGTFGGRVV